MIFIVINDVHANGTALADFVSNISSWKFDKLIFLGDVLTYGVDVKETIELLHQLESTYDCIFIKGNHEQIYFDYQAGKDFQYKKFPHFLLESIEYTANKLDCALKNEFNWLDSFEYKGIVFSHANLLGYGNWSYLNRERDFESNYKLIGSNDLRGAIFGHTHRAKYKKYLNNNSDSEILELPINSDIVFDAKDKFLLTNGSLGQPRGSVSSFLICEIEEEQVRVRSIPIVYEVDIHCKSIINSSLTVETKEKLIRYYKEI